MSSIGMKQPGCRLRDRFAAAVCVLAVPSIALAVENGTCLPVPNQAAPAARPIQLSLHVSDPNTPTPIIIDLLGFGIGAVQGVTLPEAPDAAGSAVNVGASLVIRAVSPSITLSDPNSQTIIVPAQVPVETTASLTLDPAASSGLDPFGNACALVSITDVLPGGGLLPAGSLVAVAGDGFQPGAQVLIDGIAVASVSWVDSSRIEVVTAAVGRLDGKTVSVSNPDGTGATYVSYLHATDLGKSANPLLAATEAIFPLQTQSSAVIDVPSSGTFFGLALQNPDPSDSIVSIQLWDAGSAVASASLALPSLTKVSREVSELFPGVVPGPGSFFFLMATVPVQMLGLSGNATDGSVTPILPAIASP